MRKRGSILAITFLSVLIVVVACGRASEQDINNALGIKPTATLSDEQIAQATKAAEALDGKQYLRVLEFDVNV